MSRVSIPVQHIHVDTNSNRHALALGAFSHAAQIPQNETFTSSEHAQHGHHFFGHAVSTHSGVPFLHNTLIDTTHFANRYKSEAPRHQHHQQQHREHSPSPSLTPSSPTSPCTFLPAYQSRQNEMLSVLHEFETRPSTLVSGFIRGIETNVPLVPQDLIALCFKFLQHSDLATLIDSKDHDELYALAWEATENQEYLFAEQIIAYLLRSKTTPQSLSAFTFDTNSNSNFEPDTFDSNSNPTNSNSLLSPKALQTSLSPRSLTRTPRTPTPKGLPNSRNRSRNASEDASAHNLMAVIQYFLGDLAASEAYFARAAAMDPTCDVIMNNYAVLLLEQQRYRDAEAQIERAIRAAPRCLKNRQQYAYILFSVGKLQAAARQCRLMVRMAPNVESHSGYAWLLEQMGRVEEAEAQYRELVRLEPQNAIWHFWHALLLCRCGRFGEAKGDLEECLRLDAGYEAAKGHYAYVLMLCGEVERAREVVREAVVSEECEGHLCVHFYCAVIMMCEGEGRSVQMAVNELMRCLEMLEDMGVGGSVGGCGCRNEKGCVRIDERHVKGLLAQLGYGIGC